MTDAVAKKLTQAGRDGRPTRAEAEAAVKTLISWAGDNPAREGLLDTPARVIKTWEELFRGYRESASVALKGAFEDVGGYHGLVLVRDIPFFSHCEIHLQMIIGHAHIAYHPSDVIVGLSKLARLVDVFAHRLQTQERLTAQIAEALDDALKPRGGAVMIRAEHMSMSLRGVRSHGMRTNTTCFTGIFQEDPAEQVRFITMVQGTNADRIRIEA